MKPALRQLVTVDSLERRMWIDIARRWNAVSVQFGYEDVLILSKVSPEREWEKNASPSHRTTTDDASSPERAKLVQYHDLLDRLKFLIPKADREGAINDVLDDIELASTDGRSAWFIGWLIVWNIAPFSVKRCGGVALWFVKLFVAGSG